ncbi:hypothetical protein LP419_29760 [Massilia sp. H-1]|nr:hypothetical protein LP419_29760 [Massilia sp. H-1]
MPGLAGLLTSTMVTAESLSLLTSIGSAAWDDAASKAAHSRALKRVE